MKSAARSVALFAFREVLAFEDTGTTVVRRIWNDQSVRDLCVEAIGTSTPTGGNSRRRLAGLMCNAPLQVSLDTGHDVLLRPVGIDDESKFQQIFRAMSPESRYLRFFSGANPVPDAVVRSLADADGHKHIAWGILDEGEDGAPLMAAAHAIRSEEGSDRAELALGVLDQYQAHGLSRLLIASVALSCRARGIITLEAETLPENRKANSLFKALGGKVIRPMPPTTLWEFDVAQLIETLRTMERPEGLRKVFAVNAGGSA